MASKVMVKIPVQPFNQVNKSKTNGQDLVTITRATAEPMKAEDAGPSKASVNGTNNGASDVSRVLQLEHNLRFLQEQHKLMLDELHKEILELRNKNRELQFQLIFAKGAPSTPSSPDDEMRKKLFSISPKQINATPLQVEILEKELGELRLHLQEVDAKNAALTVLAEEQKSKLDQYEQEQQQHLSEAATQPTTDQLQLMRKLEDAGVVIQRLRRENSDLRRDVAAVAQSTAIGGAAAGSAATTAPDVSVAGSGREGGREATVYANREYHRDGGGRSHHHHHHRGGRYRRNGGAGGGGGSGGGSDGQQQASAGDSWFPPLYQQPNYWTNSSRAATADLPSPPSTASSSLPSLQQQQHNNQQRRSGHNNNHSQNYGEGNNSGNNGGNNGGHRKYHNRGHHNRSGKGNGAAGGDKSN